MNVETKLPEKTETRMQKRPLSLFDDLRREMERMWVRPLGFPSLFGTPSRFEQWHEWMPTMDVLEQEGELIVRADLPGVKRDDVHVTLVENDLEIRGERRQESEVKEKDYHRSEREYGTFYRRLPLSFVPDPMLIAAKFADGVLEVKIPMPIVQQPEKKTIKVS